jgi:hypothetical protein
MRYQKPSGNEDTDRKKKCVAADGCGEDTDDIKQRSSRGSVILNLAITLIAY